MFPTPLGQFNALEMAMFRRLRNMEPFTRGDIESFGFNLAKVKLFFNSGIFVKNPHHTQTQYKVNEEIFK
jgi:hypothetical protein